MDVQYGTWTDGPNKDVLWTSFGRAMPIGMLELNFKYTKKSKIISTKILITSMYCVGWFSKIVLNKVIRNKQILIDEDTC